MSTHRSDEARAYRKLYDSPEWERLRLWQLQREPLCRRCRKRGSVTAATVVNHIKPHKGDVQAFFDPDNLESACKPCHDGAIQSFERTGRERGCDANGMPLDDASHWHDGG